ncbi:RNA methyltransferase [Desulfoferrobacter suflitae]|uniref:RNA methyltransferase n=1 Tax=Desulfoferrobacter suflitae TaxID=2865782 RepID=UPI002164EEA9|nr:RNA methyltransferase [Desulfoferrobacter suflitae]MCK8601745.1 RNA methyltransferase [Desulfoferrobacter suflitae]
MAEEGAPLYVALVHYPVLNRKGDTIASAITNLDLHDLGRLVCTFGVPACYIVTPLADQQLLAQRVLHHWLVGVGKKLHPDRERALRRLRVVASIRSAQEDIHLRWGTQPRVWATSAKGRADGLTMRHARRLLQEDSAPCLLLLGTGWGLAPSVLEGADGILETIKGVNGYNHLSVRCAAAILLDRLLVRDRSLD